MREDRRLDNKDRGYFVVPSGTFPAMRQVIEETWEATIKEIQREATNKGSQSNTDETA